MRGIAKISILFVLLLLVVSCDTNYHFEKIQGTRNFKYWAGEVEGMVYQTSTRNDYIELGEADIPYIESCVKTFDSLIGSWFSRRGANSVRTFNIGTEGEAIYYLYARLGGDAAPFGGDTDRRKVVESGAGKTRYLKRGYVIDKNQKGGVFASGIIFYGDNSPKWWNSAPKCYIPVGGNLKSLQFFFANAGGQISIHSVFGEAMEK